MRLTLCLFCCFIFSSLHAQRLDYRPGELIVRFTVGADAGAKKWIIARPEITRGRPLGQAFRTYLLYFDHDQYSMDELRAAFSKDPAVLDVQPNHLLSLRARPNDPRYDDQWHHLNIGQINGLPGADHNIEPAWDITTGGVTANGDTIVIAVIDDGTDLDHEDLTANLWRNRDEIPGNGIDDDNNGYVDDFFGFDTQRNAGTPEALQGSNHGTPVAGIIGATGNNGIGVSGVNWNVKLMSIRNAFQTAESEVLEAYSYALEARQRYDATDGAEGAYVVATNASWGEDFGRAEDSPIWCSIYDEMGAAGILNAGATANLNINVDEAGDLPTTCTSPYLVSVTNLNTSGEKVPFAGFGATAIDLGAFGEDVFTTGNDNTYDFFGGTSAATPMVAGAMALLYSAPCAAFAELLEADPAAAALLVREVILSTAAPNENLAGITVTGGQLDIGAAMTALMLRCNDCIPPTSFNARPSPGATTAITVDWRAVKSLTDLQIRYRPTGSQTWVTVENPVVPFVLGNLPSCSRFDFQLTGICPEGEPFQTDIITASTDGCCVIPEDFTIEAFPNQLFLVSWSELLAARSYRVRYRPVGDNTWLTRTIVNQGRIGIGGILDCTTYEFEFETDCDTTSTGFGNRMTAKSSGCGACLEKEYCTPSQFNNDQEYIARVDLGGLLVRASGPEPSGYFNAGELSQATFVREGVYRLLLTPQADGDLSREGWRVYIDWNQDGVLSSTEIVAELQNPDSGPASVDITVPPDALSGLTRMRVMLQFRGVRGGSCGSIALGEVEDYCLLIGDADGCPPPPSVSATYDNDRDETLLSWSASAAPGGAYRLRYRIRNSSDRWVENDVTEPRLAVTGLNLCATYELEIASRCGDTLGPYRQFLFLDDCTDTAEQSPDAVSWSVFPNPARDVVRVAWSPNTAVQHIRLFAATGQQIIHTPTQGDFADIRLERLPAGLYFVELQQKNGPTHLRKLIVR